MIKKISFLIVLINLTFAINLSIADIIPIKKPIQTKEDTQKKLLIDVIRPLPKPIKKNN